MRVASFRAFALSGLALLERCHSVVARPNTYLPYQLYNYDKLNTAGQRYWLLSPIENAPQDAKPVLFGVINTTSALNQNSASQLPFKIDIQFPAVSGLKSIDITSGQAIQEQSTILPPSSKPVLTDIDLSAVVAEYAKQFQNPTPPKIVPDATPDAGLQDTFGSIGTLIGNRVGGPIGIVIGSVIGYGIGSYIGGPIGTFIGSRLGQGMAATLNAGSP